MSRRQTKHRPHPEEHRTEVGLARLRQSKKDRNRQRSISIAMRLEGWNESVPGGILRGGRASKSAVADFVHFRLPKASQPHGGARAPPGVGGFIVTYRPPRNRRL